MMMMMMNRLALLLLPLVLASTTVHLDSGPIVGVEANVLGGTFAVHKFLGIPFASPPGRFSAPERAAPWKEALDVSVPKPACIQQFNYPWISRTMVMRFYNNPAPEESEDCLYLNVYAPATPGPSSGRAVLYWIYGGSLRFGHSAAPLYDGTKLAATNDVIIVSGNYRTNVFGFPGSPELPDHERNLGFLDQRLALDWIQRNIKAFGGDPKKVTVFGNSAGSLSIDAMITSYSKNDAPFRAAIMQSGQLSYESALQPADSTESWKQLCKLLSCDTAQSPLQCVRAIPAQKIKQTIERDKLLFDRAVDGVTLLHNLDKARSSGKFANIPLMIGTNGNEGVIFTLGLKNATLHAQQLLNSIPAYVGDINSQYAIGQPNIKKQSDVGSEILNDVGIRCASARLAADSVKAGAPVWRYFYNATFPNLDYGLNLGAYHSSEVAMVFGTYPAKSAIPQQNALSEFMQTAWCRFAKDPYNGPGWPRYTDANIDEADIRVLENEPSIGLSLTKRSKIDFRCATVYRFENQP